MKLILLCLVVVICFSGATARKADPSVWVPTWNDLRKYTIYSYAASCRVNLTEWTCFWCTYQRELVPPVKVATIFESDGVYGTYGE